MQKYNLRLTLIVVAMLAIIIGTSNITGAAARVTTLTESYVKQMITSAINAVVPGMIDETIDAQVPGMIDTLIDSKVPGMIETRLNELSTPTGGDDEVIPITNPIIIQNPLAGVLNVRDYGAKGDGVTDDRAAIQAALNAVDGTKMTTVYLPDGIYMVSMVSNGMVLAPKSNTKIQLATNATIQLMPQTGATRVTTYGIIRTVASTTNLEVCGGRIVGELTYQWYTNGRANEYGAGIRVHDSSNIYVHDMAIDDCWGDGAIFTSATTIGYCRDVEVARCTFDGAYRDNITANAILNGYFHELTFKDGLQCFVDAEPNYVGNVCHNVLFENCHGDNSVRYWGYCFGFGQWYRQILAGSLPAHGYTYNVHFKNCTGTNTYTNDPSRPDNGLWNEDQLRAECEANATTRPYFQCYINGAEIVYP